MSHLHAARFVGNVIEVAFRIGSGVVDRRRHLIMEDRQRGDGGLQAAGSPQQVPGHRFGAADRQFPRALAEGSTPASRMAFRMTRIGPSPSSDGAETWYASPDSPYPATSE